jgi:hypothetical protein
MGMKRTESSSTFTPCPEGQFRAVLADVLDLGWIDRIFEGQNQGKHPMIKLVWQVDEDNSEGKPFLVFDRKMKYSFHEKATLYGRLCAWLGKKKVEQMIADDAELESLIGFSAFIAVEHSAGADGTIYANISTIMPLPKPMQPLQVREYERWCERDSWENYSDRGDPPRKPEYSAFEDPATVRRLMAEAAGQQTMDVEPPQSRPVAPQGEFVRSLGGKPYQGAKTATDPRADNRPNPHPAKARELAADYKEDDVDDIDAFGPDDVEQVELPTGGEAPVLMNVPATRQRNTAHAG